MALYGALAERRNGSRALHPGPVLVAGLGISILVLAKISNVVAAPFFGIYLLAVWYFEQRDTPAAVRWQRLLVFGAVACGLLLTLGYNYFRFRMLVGFPLESYEQFSMPLATGVIGLLLSPGKGLLWYMPMAILALPALGWWRHERRWWDATLALFSAASMIVLYALWYDWPGGRAWGPRMVIVAVPALAMLALPALRWVGVRGWRGVLVTAVLLISMAVQVPGVLVNFERQEGLDMQAGATFEQLLWSPSHSPLLTYWAELFGPSRDPLWLQPYFTTQALWLWGSILLVAAATGLVLILARRPCLGTPRAGGCHSRWSACRYYWPCCCWQPRWAIRAPKTRVPCAKIALHCWPRCAPTSAPATWSCSTQHRAVTPRGERSCGSTGRPRSR